MKRTVGIFFILVSLASAADAPKLPEVSKLRLLAAYQKAVIAQKASQDAQAQLQAAINAFNVLAEKEIAENKLQKGSSFQVNVDSGEVTVIPPPPEKPTDPTAPKK